MASILREFLILDPALDALIPEDNEITDIHVATNQEQDSFDLRLGPCIASGDFAEEISPELVEDILSELDVSDSVASISESATEQLPDDSNNDQQVAAAESLSTTCSSVDSDDVLSIDSVLSQDDGYGSLSDCSASVCELLDPDDYSTLLETLAATIAPDSLTSPTVLGDACHNLSQCAARPDQACEAPDANTVQDYQPQVTTNPSDPGHTSTSPSDPGHTSNKPDVCYMEMIANALMSNNNSLILGDIYKHIMDSYPYYKHTTNSWKSSIRHNLSVNECFVKGRRSKSGGYFWSVHPSCIDSFRNQDFDRRKARRQVQRSNRALGSALDEMKTLRQLSQSTSNVQSDDGSKRQQIPTQQYSGHTVGATSYLPMCSTPVRGQQCGSNVQQHQGYNQHQQITYNQHQQITYQHQYMNTQPQNPYIQPQNPYTQPQNPYIQPQNAYFQPQYGYNQSQQGYNQSQQGYNGYYWLTFILIILTLWCLYITLPMVLCIEILYLLSFYYIILTFSWYDVEHID